MEPLPAIWARMKEAATISMLIAIAGRVQPRSAKRPATGAMTAPAAPASAKKAMPRWVRPKAGPARSKGTPVQNRLKAPNKAAWQTARRRSRGLLAKSTQRECSKPR